MLYASGGRGIHAGSHKQLLRVLKVLATIQVVQAFKGEGGMKQFREWVMNPDEEELREAAQPKPKRGRKQGANAQADDAAHEGDTLQGRDLILLGLLSI